jgi:hypothetical protein
MERSRSQILYNYLPGAVFQHDDEFIGRVISIGGQSAESDVNKKVLFERIEAAITQWEPEDRNIPLPSKAGHSQFEVITPDLVNWEIWPLVFQCSNQQCLRVRRFYNTQKAVQQAQAAGRLKCETCGWKLNQLRYFTAHNCGRVDPLFTPECNNCGSRNGVYFDDTGAFSSSVWRCRNCNGRYIQGQRFTPCRCGKYIKPGKKQAFQRAMTVKDSQAYYAHRVSMINLRGTHYEELLRHPRRGEAAIASLLGDETNLADLLQELDRTGDGDRLTLEEWNEKEDAYRKMGLPEEDIADLKKLKGPAESGLGRTRGSIGAELAAVGERQGLLERAALWSEVSDRRSLADAIRDSNDTAEKAALEQANQALKKAGVSGLSVTMRFPIAMAAFGYTRGSGSPKHSTLVSFDPPAGKSRKGTTKTPIYVTAVNTEALIIELSPVEVLGWVSEKGVPAVECPSDERSAKLEVVRLFAEEGDAASEIKTLVHSMSHLLLRALDDGRSGFGESSLAEWVVPEALTFAIYVSSYKAAPLGAFWTLLHSRAEAWISRAVSGAFRCDNDPLCHHRRPMACERCMFLTFGCNEFNDDLSREELMSFARYLGSR